MYRPMKLRGRIYLEDDRKLTFHGQLYDDQPFSMPVDQFDVELNTAFLPSNRWVDGWLFVQQEAQQGSVVYLTLPKPVIAHGKQISVRDLQLMPRYSSINDFKKPSIAGIKTPAPKTEANLPTPESLVESRDGRDEDLQDLQVELDELGDK